MKISTYLKGFINIPFNTFLFRSATFILLFNFLIINAFAQSKVVSGRVVAEDENIGLPGVNVIIKGTDIGTVTDADGNFKIEVASDSDILLFSFVGYDTYEIQVGSQSTLDVVLSTGSEKLSEVVITALGVERETKALGYAIQEVDGDELAESKEVNVVNSLSGKVAGVNITNGNSGVGSTSRIVIRGESSLSGDNQPLFIVDGIPISNSTDSRSNTRVDADNMNVDFGNGAADISPSDIESISVLKGPSAAALYGARAANGVVLITTKKGAGAKKGIGVSVNTSATFETPLTMPEYQNVYGQGKNFQFDFVDGNGSGIADGVDESWGPKMDGRLINQFDSPTTNGYRGGDVHGQDGTISALSLAERGDIIATPWVSHEDNVREVFQTGVTLINNVAFTGNNDNGNFRFSYTNLNNKGMLENTDLKRNSFNLSASYKLTDKFKVNASANYIHTSSDNRAVNGYGTESLMYVFIWYGRQIDTRNMRDYWQRDLEGVQQFNYNYNYHDNPFFTLYENVNGMGKDRIIGNVSATYSFTDRLSLMVRTGTDFFDELRTWQRAYSTQRFKRGQYREDVINFQETNTDFLLSYQSEQNSDFSYGISVGGNLMNQKYAFSGQSANQLVIPSVYNFGNSAIPLVSYLERTEKSIHSLYGTAQFAFKNMIFLDLTGRNDWSSTLPSGNNSYFYPSASLSGIVSDMVELPDFMSFAKVRVGVAQVGNDTGPYNLKNYYSYGQAFLGNPTASESSSLANSDLKPERINSYEVGTDLRFFNERLGLDFTYYKASSFDQIIQVQIPRTSGYSGRWINAGKIESQGLELTLYGSPVKTNDFRWDVNVNWSRNRSKVIELAEGLDTYTISSNSLLVLAKVGGRMGDVYGTGFEKTPDGRVIYDSNGNPIVSNELRNLGNYNPDWIGSLLNTFSYKNLSLSVLFDQHQGGVVLSRTLLIGSTAGNMIETLEGRDSEHGGLTWTDGDGNVRTDGIIGDGVVNVGTDENPVYEENTTVVEASTYYNKHFKRQHEEQGMYDASYIKLREVKFGYTLPSKLISKTPFQQISVSLVGRNLLLWTENPHFDPEAISFGGEKIVPGVENANLPSARSYGFNISIKL